MRDLCEQKFRGNLSKIEAILRLCIYGERNNGKVIAKYFFYIDKFYLNKKSITVNKSLIQ